MSSRVEGKVAFITGAARGQGRSHAVHLAEEGADIIAVDLCDDPGIDYPIASEDDLAETVRLVEATGRRIVASKADVRDFDSLQSAVDDGTRALGRLDIVCANAGIMTMGTSWELDENTWGNTIDTNLSGVWRTTKATIPYLLDQDQGGSIILTSSIMGLKGAAGCVAYCSAKFGVTGFGQALAHELAPHRIRVNTIHPTNVRTPMLESESLLRILCPDIQNPSMADAEEVYASISLWDVPWVEVDDVSKGLVWLASDESRFVTGTALPIDLGATAL